MLWHRYSNLAYYLRNHWFSKLLIILWYHWYKLTHYYPMSDTTTLMIWYSWHNNLLYYYTWLDTTTFTYNTWYNNKYTYMMILDTAISILWHLIQQSHLLIYNNDSASFLMPLWYSWYKTLITYLYNYSKTWHSEYYPWTRRPPARYWRTPHRCAYQERLGGRHATIQDYEFRVIILFFSVLPFMLFDIRLSEDP